MTPVANASVERSAGTSGTLLRWSRRVFWVRTTRCTAWKWRLWSRASLVTPTPPTLGSTSSRPPREPVILRSVEDDAAAVLRKVAGKRSQGACRRSEALRRRVRFSGSADTRREGQDRYSTL